MDDIDKQLQFEELRLIFNDIKNGINSLKDLLGSNLQITIPDNIAVDSKVILENKIDSLDISNLHILKEWIEDQTNQLRSVIKENKPETQRDIIVKNLKDIPKVESVTIKNWSDFDKFTKSVVNAIKENKSEVNVTKQEIKLPTSAKEPISVRLSDGKSFYNAIAAMTSGLQIPRIQSTTTPAVYGVPVVNPDGSSIGSLSGSTIYITVIREDSIDPQITYVGKALPGTATSEASWQIASLDENTNLDLLYADGGAFTQVYDNREGLTYA